MPEIDAQHKGLVRLINELHAQMALPLLDAAIALAKPDLCEALAAAALDGLVLETGHGPYDLKASWEEAMRVCGCEMTKDA